VIYALNTKNDEQEANIQALKDAHEEEIQHIRAETRKTILQYKSKAEEEQLLRKRIQVLEDAVVQHKRLKEEALAELTLFKMKVKEKELRMEVKQAEMILATDKVDTNADFENKLLYLNQQHEGLLDECKALRENLDTKETVDEKHYVEGQALINKMENLKSENQRVTEEGTQKTSQLQDSSEREKETLQKAMLQSMAEQQNCQQRELEPRKSLEAQEAFLLQQVKKLEVDLEEKNWKVNERKKHSQKTKERMQVEYEIVIPISIMEGTETILNSQNKAVNEVDELKSQIIELQQKTSTKQMQNKRDWRHVLVLLVSILLESLHYIKCNVHIGIFSSLFCFPFVVSENIIFFLKDIFRNCSFKSFYSKEFRTFCLDVCMLGWLFSVVRDIALQCVCSVPPAPQHHILLCKSLLFVFLVESEILASRVLQGLHLGFLIACIELLDGTCGALMYFFWHRNTLFSMGESSLCKRQRFVRYLSLNKPYYPPIQVQGIFILILLILYILYIFSPEGEEMFSSSLTRRCLDSSCYFLVCCFVFVFYIATQVHNVLLAVSATTNLILLTFLFWKVAQLKQMLDQQASNFKESLKKHDLQSIKEKEKLLQDLQNTIKENQNVKLQLEASHQKILKMLEKSKNRELKEAEERLKKEFSETFKTQHQSHKLEIQILEERAKKELHDELEQMQKRQTLLLGSLRLELSEQQTLCMSLRKQIEELQEELCSMRTLKKQQARSNQRQIRSLRDELEKSQHEVSSLRKENLLLKDTMELLSAELGSQKQEAAQLQDREKHHRRFALNSCFNFFIWFAFFLGYRLKGLEEKSRKQESRAEDEHFINCLQDKISEREEIIKQLVEGRTLQHSLLANTESCRNRSFSFNPSLGCLTSSVKVRQQKKLDEGPSRVISVPNLAS
ncbi:F184B protein, partial [Eudromia elegans]|nr:F184B protein [Eudromia elegans]